MYSIIINHKIVKIKRNKILQACQLIQYLNIVPFIYIHVHNTIAQIKHKLRGLQMY